MTGERARSIAVLALVGLLHLLFAFLLLRDLDVGPAPMPETVTFATVAPLAARPAVAPAPTLASPSLRPPVIRDMPMPSLVPASPAPPHRKRPATLAIAAFPPAPTAAAESPAPVATASVAVADGDPVPLPSNPPPAYPELARRKGFVGTVVLRVEVSAQGQPTAIALATSSGHDFLDERAIETVWRWHFAPARARGLAVAGLVLVPIIFELHA